MSRTFGASTLGNSLDYSLGKSRSGFERRNRRSGTVSGAVNYNSLGRQDRSQVSGELSTGSIVSSGASSTSRCSGVERSCGSVSI